MFFDLRKAHRRVDRNRYCASIENAEEDHEKFDAGRKHHANPVTWRDVARDQTLCDPPGPGCKFSVGEGAENRRLILQHGQMQPIGVSCGMPLKRLDQGARFVGSRYRGKASSR